jgi:hypothetical protein
MRDPFAHMDEASKHIIDAISVATVLGTLIEMLPSIAAGLSIIWSVIRIYETKTVQSWLGRNNDAKQE